MKMDFKQFNACHPVATSHQIKVVLFCGGRGSASIIHELLRWPNIDLTLIVNAYDDGLSTGALRRCVSKMLGPSDFRKNLSYLLDPYSKEQYALKRLLEMRFSDSVNEQEIDAIKTFIKTKKNTAFTHPMISLFHQIGPVLSAQLCHFLQLFFNYAQETGLIFDYRDCSFGNLIFTGAYVEQSYNFNAAAKTMSQLVNSRALLVNVSQGENRILVGLKIDGELLASEAQLVGPQSAQAIHSIYLLEKAIDADEWQGFDHKTVEEKAAWLRAQDMLPEMSLEAQQALAQADIILYGPGTQHSSLFPSYRIAQAALQSSPAGVKMMVMNLAPDNDIQSLSSDAIVDQALIYMGDPHNQHKVITHVLVDNTCPMNHGGLVPETLYKQSRIIQDGFANSFNPHVHNGRIVIDKTFAVWEQTMSSHQHHLPSQVSIFIDIHQRPLALAELYDEMLEMDWSDYFTRVNLVVNQTPVSGLPSTAMILLKTEYHEGNFPEVSYFIRWLQQESSEYLMLLTGDGKYRFRDVNLAIKLLEQSHFGAVFGSRTQSRTQFKSSLRAAYGEKKLLSLMSFLGSLLISSIFALRFSILFSDPLTGFRLFKRSRLAPIMHDIGINNISSSISLATYLIKNHIEIAELPVHYRTFAGFVDPYWRMHRGMKNLLSLFMRH